MAGVSGVVVFEKIDEIVYHKQTDQSKQRENASFSWQYKDLNHGPFCNTGNGRRN